MEPKKKQSNQESKSVHSMNDKLLHTILHFLPKKNRNDAMEQINYYLKELKYKRDQGQKFALSDEKMEIIVYALVVYQRIISPIKHSIDFYDRMTNEFNVDTISVGTYSLNEEASKSLNEIVEEFNKIAYLFFMSNGIEKWQPILSAESIDDLTHILRTG